MWNRGRHGKPGRPKGEAAYKKTPIPPMGREPKASAVPPMFDAIFCILWPLCMAGVRRSFGRSLMCPLGSCLGRSPGRALSVWTPSLQTGGFCLLLLLHGGIQKQYGTKGEDCQEKAAYGAEKAWGRCWRAPRGEPYTGLGGRSACRRHACGGHRPPQRSGPRTEPAPPHRRIPFAPGSGGQEAACPRFPQKKPRHFHAEAAGHSIISGMPSPSMSR